jgi:hypothetical protein
VQRGYLISKQTSSMLVGGSKSWNLAKTGQLLLQYPFFSHQYSLTETSLQQTHEAFSSA